MTGTAPPLPARSRIWLGVLGAAVVIGIYLRLDQIAMQVLIDDEWHAVHQFIAHTPREMFLDFGYADYSIPLGIFDWYQAQWWGVSELTLRWPMIACGLATLVVLPLHVARRLGAAPAAANFQKGAMQPVLLDETIEAVEHVMPERKKVGHNKAPTSPSSGPARTESCAPRRRQPSVWG